MKKDPLTLDLFDAVPEPVPANPGGLGLDNALRELLSRLLKATPLTRLQVAKRMAELLGQSVTKYQLDSWTSGSREAWRFPMAYAPALEVALGTHELTAWMAEVRGAKLLIGRDSLLAELGEIERQKQRLGRKERALKGYLASH